MTFRDAKVLTWDRDTGVSTIQVGEDMIMNPLNLAGVGSSFEPGDNVAVLERNGRWFILGRKL